jgi:lactate racemase
MRISMSYGKRGLPVDLPDEWDVTTLSKKRMPVEEDPRACVAGALRSPLGSGPLAREAAGCRSACILICDITRPVPNHLVLRPLIEELLGAGLRTDGITILVATGLHRPNEGQELAGLIGDPWVSAHVRAANHIARRDEDHADLGTTSQGVPVRIDRRFIEADLRIAVGLVEPHFMAGWSGGRKLILPGIAHAQSISAFHSARMLAQERAATCTLEGNPLHEAQLEVLRMVGGCLGVNLVIDESRALSFASFGDIQESHRAAVRFAAPFFQVPVSKPFPVVLTSAAGFPLDATYYQAVKGICGGATILRKGGHLFVVSECLEGLGSPEFRAAQGRLRDQGRERFRAEVSSHSAALVDEWETFMLLKALDQGAVHLLTAGLQGEERSLTCVEPVSDLVAELRHCVEQDPEQRIAVIPEGPYVAPALSSP